MTADALDHDRAAGRRSHDHNDAAATGEPVSAHVLRIGAGAATCWPSASAPKRPDSARSGSTDVPPAAAELNHQEEAR